LLASAIEEYGKNNPNVNITIPWSTISKSMGNRSRLSCFKKWQKLTGTASPRHNHNASVTVSAKDLAIYAAEHGVQRTIQVHKNNPTQLFHHLSSHQASSIVSNNNINISSRNDAGSNKRSINAVGSSTIRDRQRAWRETQAFNDATALHQFSHQSKNSCHNAFVGVSRSNNFIQRPNSLSNNDVNREDQQLLEHLVSLNIHSSDDIMWASLSHSQGAWNRFLQIVTDENVDYRRSVVGTANEILTRWRMGIGISYSKNQPVKTGAHFH